MRSIDSTPLTPIKRALLEIRQLRAQLLEAEKVWREPIAIVGMGLRLPGGVHDAESFAKLLWSGADACHRNSRKSVVARSVLCR